jgi:septal ring factor EnvC (AmiA/AmiB activator)
MPSKRTNGGRTKSGPTHAEARRGLERRVKRLERELAAVRAAYERKLELVRRAANRRLASMMKEIASLRHHEARAEALERLLATRPAPAPTEGTLDGEDPRLPG